MPDGKHFSVVRVEKDSTQRLWQFSLDGREPKLLLEKVKPIGYHAWANENQVALFVLGTPNTFQLADIRMGNTEVLAQSIGRSLHKIPRQHAISFVHKTSEEKWLIKQLDLDTNEIVTLVETLDDSEDYAWMSDGTILMGKGGVLYAWKVGSDMKWNKIADFTSSGVTQISRLAVNSKGDKIALVSNINSTN